ncbi:MAG: hypothetical protein JW825_03290 [Candidatus Methanofastidiosa archaeon]|nr:hypothetical protein [Candidatus Methanofastidiosa archaeon]
MVEINIRKVGAIYVALVLVVLLAYYYSLPSQDEFIRDNRWLSDKSALNLVLENEVTLMYTYEYAEIREKLPTGYRIGNNTVSIPLDSEQDFLDQLEIFKASIDTAKIPQEEIDAYFGDVIEKYYYDEFQYTSAITTIDLQLIIEHLTKIAPNIPPIISSTENVEIRLHAISIIQNNVWRVKFLVEEDIDGNFFAPDEALMRYFGYEPEFVE